MTKEARAALIRMIEAGTAMSIAIIAAEKARGDYERATEDLERILKEEAAKR